LFAEGPAVDEETVEIPRMDAKLAEDIVRKWQSIKSKALGPEHSAPALQEVRFKILTFFLLQCTTLLSFYVARDN
jgi:hypothetical protein